MQGRDLTADSVWPATCLIVDLNRERSTFGLEGCNVEIIVLSPSETFSRGVLLWKIFEMERLIIKGDRRDYKNCYGQ